MKRFIPAWYSQNQWWESQAHPFYRKRAITEFDDMISLMSMHYKNNVQFEIIVLNYNPGLRTFLHRHDLFEASYWSVFDEIQGFNHQTPQSVDYRELKWPTGTEFIYTPYLIQAIMNEHCYSNIYFSQDGYLIWIEDYEDKVLCRRYVFDDRGNLSSMIYYDCEGKPDFIRYMTCDGDWILEENVKNGTVDVHKKYYHRFKYHQYSSMVTVIQEYLHDYCATSTEQDDIIFVASDVRHNTLIAQSFNHHRLCYSVFKQRNQDLNEKALASMTIGQNWLVDTLENEQKLNAYKTKQRLSNRLMRITPFDAQTMSNISSQLHETYIGLWIDGLSEAKLKALMSQCVQYMKDHESMRIVLMSKMERHHISQWLLNEINVINDQFNGKSDVSEEIAELMKEDETIDYVELKIVPFEIDIVEAISTLRIMVDLSEEPDLFLQICCLGAGLPQINQRQTDYVQHGANGLVITTDESLIGALDYFLAHLKHWNYSYAYAQKLSKNYASEKIIEQLDQLIEGEYSGA
ncbi:accessory Sec system protein Asp1 [Staphylococcus agnetis]|uniref:accessory Sec system protein Asp1 n=1 Tax=Staphylococcus agnetis TaxID=985762 RepID=UPI000D19B726|nr:accessory Sec system protein Asp1 [Staphylococcus agnetis]PTH31521.1 accessory Sec system protein Asp1 [Staphylococcus agnetis]PTH70334.1 accessory Sec system protein Asp1 [Staphylococcus agnetis]PTH76502.1 accessory Sec system protein Asp1 [Staphylococcus agnetis]